MSKTVRSPKHNWPCTRCRTSKRVQGRGPTRSNVCGRARRVTEIQRNARTSFRTRKHSFVRFLFNIAIKSFRIRTGIEHIRAGDVFLVLKYFLPKTYRSYIVAELRARCSVSRSGKISHARAILISPDRRMARSCLFSGRWKIPLLSLFLSISLSLALPFSSPCTHNNSMIRRVQRRPFGSIFLFFFSVTYRLVAAFVFDGIVNIHCIAAHWTHARLTRAHTLSAVSENIRFVC
jgi:hypothetical protein